MSFIYEHTTSFSRTLDRQYGMGIFVTHTDFSYLSREQHPEQREKSYSDNRNSKNLRKRAILGSNFTAVVGPCGAKNQKMVLTNVVQDDILYLKLNYQHMLQKFPYPTKQPRGRQCRSADSSSSQRMITPSSGRTEITFGSSRNTVLKSFMQGSVVKSQLTEHFGQAPKKV